MITLENFTIDGNTLVYRGWEIYYDSLECAWCAENGADDMYGKSIEDCCIKINEVEDKNVKI